MTQRVLPLGSPFVVTDSDSVHSSVSGRNVQNAEAMRTYDEGL
jgi:hypothetical protein